MFSVGFSPKAFLGPKLAGVRAKRTPAFLRSLKSKPQCGAMRKLIVLVEALALAAVTVTAITVNPRTVEMMVAASQAATSPHASAIEKIIAFAQAAGAVAMLTVNPQFLKPWPH